MIGLYDNQGAILRWLQSRGHRVKPGRNVSKKLSSHIGLPCPYCSTEMVAEGAARPSREHKIPRSRGGPNGGPNRIVVCLPCNYDKDSMTLTEWWAELARMNDSRADFVAAVIAAGH